MTHDLKCWPAPFAAALDGSKVHEIRSCLDRDFNVGDVLHLREFEPGATPGHGGRWIGETSSPHGRLVADLANLNMLSADQVTKESPDGCYWSAFTGRVLDVVVTYVSRGPEWGLPAEIVVMSIRRKE